MVWEYSTLCMFIVGTIPGLHALVDYFILLYYIKPYRVYVLETLYTILNYARAIFGLPPKLLIPLQFVTPVQSNFTSAL